ncbi:hypothetical protein [Reichenbachiella sp. MSK19-1]|uniref:hypothetical protein n=1 Tax=Reichenbachiella sp. MSK19-1 TaxID=1897631 RepID=UPI0011C3CFB5|nr:hypothetical protein [Reichenbachiella sp. MSK19-1]
MTILSSEITIAGSTNVNSFECGLEQNAGHDVLKVDSRWTTSQLNFEGLELNYKVVDFDCGMQVMNQDFREILHADQYPRLVLKVQSIQIPNTNKEIERLHVYSNVIVQIAGERRQFIVKDGRVINKSENELIFEGSRLMKISDFGIEPPTKYMGMVKVNDEITIQFSIRMRVDTLKE